MNKIIPLYKRQRLRVNKGLPPLKPPPSVAVLNVMFAIPAYSSCEFKSFNFTKQC
ncbi:hypothetical protein HMPREF9554_01758 [Treponema phagedenis F0421]|nr:hypothetical protein HMPREF9554_01758 [Treponema phagedenis F0421]